MDKVIQGVLVTVIILGSGYLAYSFVVPVSDIPEVVEVITPTDNIEAVDTDKSENSEYESIKKTLGTKTYKSDIYGYKIDVLSDWVYEEEVETASGYTYHSVFFENPRCEDFNIRNPIPETDAGYIGSEIIDRKETVIDNTKHMLRWTYLEPEIKSEIETFGRHIFITWNFGDDWWVDTGRIHFGYQDKNDPCLKEFEEIVSTFGILE